MLKLTIFHSASGLSVKLALFMLWFKKYLLYLNNILIYLQLIKTKYQL